MLTAGHNYEQTLLRSMKEGIEKQLIPDSEIEIHKLKQINKIVNLGLGVNYDYNEKYTKCDVAVMLGSWKPLRGSMHHQVRTDIKNNAKCFICIETPILNRTLEFEKCNYFRVGVNGFVNKDAYFGPNIKRPDDRLLKLGNLKFSQSVEEMKKLDTLIFDIQDVGSRYYTYAATMALCMQVAAPLGVKIVVLDRPNPIGGGKVEGGGLTPGLENFCALYPVPQRHGMTVGELANLYNTTFKPTRSILRYSRSSKINSVFIFFNYRTIF